jgi:gamma-glutamyltranspeptidase
MKKVQIRTKENAQAIEHIQDSITREFYDGNISAEMAIRITKELNKLIAESNGLFVKLLKE